METVLASNTGATGGVGMCLSVMFIMKPKVAAWYMVVHAYNLRTGEVGVG